MNWNQIIPDKQFIIFDVNNFNLIKNKLSDNNLTFIHGD